MRNIWCESKEVNISNSDITRHSQGEISELLLIWVAMMIIIVIIMMIVIVAVIMMMVMVIVLMMMMVMVIIIIMMMVMVAVMLMVIITMTIKPHVCWDVTICQKYVIKNKNLNLLIIFVHIMATNSINSLKSHWMNCTESERRVCAPVSSLCSMPGVLYTCPQSFLIERRPLEVSRFISPPREFQSVIHIFFSHL